MTRWETLRTATGEALLLLSRPVAVLRDTHTHTHRSVITDRDNEPGQHFSTGTHSVTVTLSHGQFANAIS